MISRQEAERTLQTTIYPKAPLEETEIVRASYVFETEKMYELEKTTFDITKANFVVFGAVMLVSNTSYFAQVYGPHRSVVVAVALIALVSLAASVLVTLFHKYLLAHRQKVSILRRAVWRRRPLEWLEVKYVAEDLKTQFEKTARLGLWEYVAHRYTLKYVNLIPAIVALLAGAAMSYWLPDVPPKDTPSPATVEKTVWLTVSWRACSPSSPCR
ncbi:hypothetical protein OIU34_17555 [Pararhizobium sp. BT-229]|uniref:hypothetical protein n=1 Tax=Pararhizobium sp. BT-229 TaxID=2986923 RepID=UPI0021F7DA36|nr:hypothetical protein [Pararhizobium sp. BT-229]MCV9963704.1 hypothetical protein [Pararhizobium sp. BT-229]